MNQILISVVIPCFNQGAYIQDALDSLLAQTQLPAEIIVVDDGSTDSHTQTMLDALSIENVRIIRTENLGVSAARNTGVKQAQHSFILNLDADDVLRPTFLEKAALILQKESTVGAVSSWLELFGAQTGIWQSKGGKAEDFLASNQSGPNALFRREFWEEAGGYDETMRQGFEDWDFWLSGTKKGWTVAVIPEPLTLYRKKEERTGLTIAYEHKPEIMRYMIEKHLTLFKENLLDVLYEKEQLIDRMYHSEVYQAGLEVLNRRSPIA